MDRYFQKLPNIFYNNTLCKDITRRTKLIEKPRQSPFVFYPFELKNQLRSDHVAEYYYEDSELDWLIYMTNGIVDPYYQWYLNDSQFESLLIEKYQSLENAQKRIAFYRNNWATDSQELSVSQYNSIIVESWKKYYSPIWGPGTKIVGYKRKQIDSITNTNRIVEYTIQANNTSISLSDGELVDIKITGQQQTVGTGEVIISNSSILRIKNVSGNTQANTTFTKTIVGEQSAANVTVSNSDVIFENITIEEQVFWSPVSFYDYHQEINEQNKNIKLVAAGQHTIVVDQFEQVVREDVDSVTGISQFTQ